eukprot:Nk52_evm6s2011 gene=Nk52_evmTU6s2011
MIKAGFLLVACVIAIFYVIDKEWNRETPITRCLTINESVAILEAQGVFHGGAAPAPRGAVKDKDGNTKENSFRRVCPRIVVKDDSRETLCQEVDNVKSGLFVGDYSNANPSAVRASVTGFRLRAFHPVVSADFHHFGSNFTNCPSLTSDVFMKIGRFGGGPGQFNTKIAQKPGIESYVYHAEMNGLPNNCSPGNDSSTLFPDSMQYGQLDNVTIYFTSWIDSDQRGLYGAKGTHITVAISFSDDDAVLGMYFTNNTSTVYPNLLGNCILNKTTEIQYCYAEIPDLYKPKGCYTSALQMLLRPVKSKLGSASRPRILFDALQFSSRGGRAYPIQHVLSTKEHVVDAAYQDFWFRYPQLLNITTTRTGDKEYTGSMLTYAQSRRTYYIDQLVQTFVMYEDGNIRLTPYPKKGWLQVPFGFSFIFGKRANYSDERPVEPVRSIRVIESSGTQFKAEVTFQPNTLDKPWLSKNPSENSDYSVTFELKSSEKETELTITGIQDWALPGARLGVFRSMTVTKPPIFPALNDIDTALAYDAHSRTVSGHLTYPAPGKSISGDTVAFIRRCPSFHNSDAPEFSAELLCN